MAALEHAPTDRNCLNTVFRGFHPIKGGAGFLDFVPMVHICHAVEDRLNVARDGTVPMDAAAFDDTQQSLDLLVDMLAAVSAGEEPEHAPPALLKSLRDGAAGKAVASAGAHAAPAGGDIDDSEFEALLDSLHGSPSAAPAPAAASKKDRSAPAAGAQA